MASSASRVATRHLLAKGSDLEQLVATWLAAPRDVVRHIEGLGQILRIGVEYGRVSSGIRGDPVRESDVALVRFSTRRVELVREHFRLDPDTSFARREAQRAGLGGWRVTGRRRSDLGSGGHLGGELRRVRMTTPQKRTLGEYGFADFEVEVLRELSSVRHAFHATRAAVLPSIEERGLLPSRTFEQGSGWTRLNLDLQPAVYLTLSYGRAWAIANTLRLRFREPAAVLRVDGSVLGDYRKLVVDEDALKVHHRDFGTMKGDPDERVPGFVQSILHNVESFGFLGRIPPDRVRVVKVLPAPGPDEGADDGDGF